MKMILDHGSSFRIVNAKNRKDGFLAELFFLRTRDLLR